MIDFFYELNPLWQAFIASLFTFSMTTLGSALVFLFKKTNKNIMDSLLGISAGIMLAAAIFSLLLPSIEQSNSLGMPTILVVSIGILFGGLLLILGDKISSKYVLKEESKLKRVLLLTTSIILHNIPEGIAIGVAFGSVIYGIEGATIAAAISLAAGIAIQNVPEGAAISIPLRREGLKRHQAFLVGMSSGIVEPISALIGVVLVLKIKVILPYLLAFAAGAMIFVVIVELIPESQSNKNKNLIALLSLIGFIFMLMLEIGI